MGDGYGNEDEATYLDDNLISEQGHVLATFTVGHLQIVSHLERLLVGIETHTVFGWKEPNAAQHFALPPIRIRGIDDCHLCGVRKRLSHSHSYRHSH